MTYEQGRRLENFIEKQNQDWKRHCQEIGLIGRVLEKIFGSQYAHAQLLEFQHFCNNGYKL